MAMKTAQRDYANAIPLLLHGNLGNLLEWPNSTASGRSPSRSSGALRAVASVLLVIAKPITRQWHSSKAFSGCQHLPGAGLKAQCPYAPTRPRIGPLSQRLPWLDVAAAVAFLRKSLAAGGGRDVLAANAWASNAACARHAEPVEACVRAPRARIVKVTRRGIRQNASTGSA